MPLFTICKKKCLCEVLTQNTQQIIVFSIFFKVPLNANELLFPAQKAELATVIIFKSLISIFCLDNL